MEEEKKEQGQAMLVGEMIGYEIKEKDHHFPADTEPEKPVYKPYLIAIIVLLAIPYVLGFILLILDIIADINFLKMLDESLGTVSCIGLS